MEVIITVLCNAAVTRVSFYIEKLFSKFLVDCTELCPCYDNCPNGCPCTYESNYCSTTEETCQLQNAEEIKACDDDAFVKGSSTISLKNVQVSET